MLTIREAMLTEHETFLSPTGEEPDRVPFGIYHLDAGLYAGVRPLKPQINYIQGPSGSRKTTTALNIWFNMALSGTLPPDMLQAWETLESGMTVERLALTLHCMLTSKVMIYEFHTGSQDNDSLWQLFNRDLPDLPPHELLNITSKSGRPEMNLNPDWIEACYLGYGGATLSPRQLNAWERTAEVLESLPMVFFGSSEHPLDETWSDRYTDTPNVDAAAERWRKLAKANGSCQICSDFAQQYRIMSNGSVVHNHYEKQLALTPYIDDWVKETGKTFWLVGQEGVGDAKDAERGRTPVGSSGGSILKQSSHFNIRVDYWREKNPYWVIVTAMKVRRGNFPRFGQMIEPYSGAFFGRSVDYGKISRHFGY